MGRKHVRAIREAGVVGAGGAGFPTYVKLDADVEVVIANGAECEPLLRVDRQLMDAHAGEVARGIEVAMEATGAKRGIIGVKRKYTKAIASLERAIEGRRGISFHMLDNVYPAGDEFVLVHGVLGKLVPEGGIPLGVGVVVDNVGTLINVARAVDGQPVTTRYVTVTGEVDTPVTLEVPIGASLQDLIRAAGGATSEDTAAIVGGPMMGRVSFDMRELVTKTTSGLVVLPSEHYVIRKKTADLSRQVVQTKSACIQCSLCTQMCPRYLLGHALEPHRTMRSIAWGVTEQPERFTGAFLCVECGLCTFYACPMGLDPSRMNHEVKGQLAKAGLRNPHKRSELVPNQFRALRKVPVSRLVMRLDLGRYDVEAPLRKGILGVDEVAIPLRQHIGAQSKAVVKVGDKVEAGQVLGEIPEKAIGSVIHASIPGKVTEVSDVVRIKGG